jgi:hypothetical protein
MRPYDEPAKATPKLEARLTDISGLVPYSEAWFDYWVGKIDQLLAGAHPGTIGRIPHEVVDSIMETAENARHDQTSARSN